MSVVFPIENSDRFESYTASAGQTVFSVPFPFQDNADVTIRKIALSGTVSILEEATDYTLTGAEDPEGGTFTLLEGAAVGEKYQPIGAAILDRLTSVVRNGRFASKATDDEFDRNRIIQQEQSRDIKRAVKVDFGADELAFPAPIANRLIGWDAAGEKLEDKDAGKLGAILLPGTVVEGNMVAFGSDPKDLRDSGFGVINEDDMASDSDTKVPTQQSVNAGKLQKVATRTAVKRLSGATHPALYLYEAGREGVFVWDGSDLSIEVAADTAEGIYVAPTSDDTGASGAWVRQYGGALDVRWFGAAGDGSTDDSAAFQGAVDNLPTIGGRIVVPTASYVIDTVPDEGAKSVFWDFGPDVQFSGAGADAAGEFPFMSVNISQLAVGPFIRSRSSIHSVTNGGIAAFNVEMIQPDDYGIGNSVALYVAARSANPDTLGNSWAINPVITADAGAGGHFQGIEVDVNNFSEDALSVKGISISGRGDVDATVGLEVVRLQGRWTNGITIYNSDTALDIIQDTTSSIGRGLLINGSGTAMPVSVGAAASIKQAADGKETIILQRFTDTDPTGYFLRATAISNANLFYVDVAGNVKSNARITGNIMEGGSMLLTGSPEIAGANKISLGANTEAGAALPGDPVGYWKINVAGTVRKVPFF